MKGYHPLLTYDQDSLVGHALPARAVRDPSVPEGASDARVRVGEPFPSLVLPSLADGAPLSIEQFRGRKILLFQFASW